MAMIYVGPSSAGAADGTSWANRYGSLNAAEDRPVVAGDTVYVGPGTYRELLTVDVSGSAGNPITYIGDYDGSHTDGVGGVVRVTGSADDVAETRSSCVTATSKNYRTFLGLTFDLASSACVNLATNCSNWVVENCYFGPAGGDLLSLGGSGTNHTIRRCWFMSRPLGGLTCIEFSHSATISNSGHVVENCIMLGGVNAVNFVRVGGATVRNCLMMFSERSVRISTALAVGQTNTVNNCLIAFAGTVALQATTSGEITENYNALFGNAADRTFVTAGANSNNYPPLLDTRWFFEAVAGGDLVSPFDLASYSGLINVAGTSPPAADLRGTGTVGSQREWGPMEYDPALAIEAGSGAAGGMGGIFGSIVR